MFSQLRVWDTEHNNGVLIYLLLADQAVEIVADHFPKQGDNANELPDQPVLLSCVGGALACTHERSYPMNPRFNLARLALAVALIGCAGLAPAQGAGNDVSESPDLANGWSVKNMLMGKAVYNEDGVRVGNIEDLIISPDKRLSYVIIGAGGFIGIGRHDVALPVSRLEDSTGRLVIPHATRESLKAMPAFTYGDDTMRRRQFIATAERDVDQAKVAITALEKKASTATAEAKGKLQEQIATIKEQISAVETQLDQLKSASIKRWHEFEAAVSAATARLRDSLKSSSS